MATIGDVFRASIERLEAKRLQVASDLLSGKCSSFDEYKKQVGIGEGLRLAIEEFKSSLKKIHESDED